VDLLVNDQMVPKIMGKMPFADWKDWATKRPEWAREDLGVVFEKFVERKWRDALNVAAAEPSRWDISGSRAERAQSNKALPKKATPERAARLAGKATKTAGVATVATTGAGYKGRRCRFF
jgi:hypothetical protein